MMMRSIACVLGCVLFASSVSSVSSVANAQSTPRPPDSIPPGYVPVLIRGDAPGVHYRILADRSEANVLTNCDGDCTVYLPPGRYRLNVGETDDTRAGTRRLEVAGPMSADVSPRTKSAQTVGLTLGVIGSVLVLVGAVGLVASLSSHHSNSLGTGGDIAMLAFVGGAIMAPIGWVNFGRSSPSVETSELVALPRPSPPMPRETSAVAASLAFAVLPIPRLARGLEGVRGAGSTELTGALLSASIRF